MSKVYQAEVVRSDGWWAARVRELRGVHTQAKRLEQIEGNLREAITLWLDDDNAVFDVALDIKDLPVDPVAVKRARAEAAHAVDAANELVADAVMRLTAAGLPMRDIGALLDLSHQRVGQIAAATNASPSARKKAAKVLAEP